MLICSIRLIPLPSSQDYTPTRFGSKWLVATASDPEHTRDQSSQKVNFAASLGVMGFREDTKVLNGLTIKTVGSLLGINLPARGMAHCPFPDHEDRTPSFEVRRDGLRWTCYGCQRNGGAIDLVMAFHGTNFIQAKNWLAETSSIKGSRVRERTPQARRRNFATSDQSALKRTDGTETQPDHVIYSALLNRAQLGETGARYLRSRGFSDEIVRRFAVGQMPGDCCIN